MNKDTNIRFYSNTNNSAPQIENRFGCVLDVLDACLVHGLNLGTISTLTAIGTVVTAVFSSNHNLRKRQIIRITGAEQNEFNGDHKVLTIPSNNTATFQLQSPPLVTTATGLISSSLPPLGWEKSFSGVGKAAYRSTNVLLSSRPYLRVVDALDPNWTPSYAKFAKVGLIETMNNIDDLSGFQVPFDSQNASKNWVASGSGANASNGWAKWYYALNAAPHITQNETQPPVGGVVGWHVFGDENVFYIAIQPTNLDGHYALYGFGAIDSCLRPGTNDTFLISCLNNTIASTNQAYSGKTGGVNANSSICLHGGVTGGGSKDAFVMGTVWDKNYSSGWFDTISTTASVNQLTSQPILYENNVPIGTMPFLHWLYSKMPINSASAEASNIDLSFIPVNVSTGSGKAGQILMRVA
ncbi:hypothetical protein BEN71_11015 [Acinetobacter wuhouensis]|uniref:hypothetical protein n=1 Tax=Acinetobacter wuhouensis TaxID=1879050 RepID=UPI00083ACE15|nr:hypothetical protein [Acinetobacter wuhouensis]AXQ22570.1 hypothetical protein BEN71_11015 [Acinetobacter wuhouensis]